MERMYGLFLRIQIIFKRNVVKFYNFAWNFSNISDFWIEAGNWYIPVLSKHHMVKMALEGLNLPPKMVTLKKLKATF